MATAQEADNTQFAQELDGAKEKLAEGLVALLQPMIQDLDLSVVAVRESQIDLVKEIDRLSGELQKFLDNSKTPMLEPYVQKLSNSRRRVQAVNQNLRTIQERLERLYAAASRRRPIG